LLLGRPCSEGPEPDLPCAPPQSPVKYDWPGGVGLSDRCACAQAFVSSSLNAPSKRKQSSPTANAHRRRPILRMTQPQEFMIRLQVMALENGARPTRAASTIRNLDIGRPIARELVAARRRWPCRARHIVAKAGSGEFAPISPLSFRDGPPKSAKADLGSLNADLGQARDRWRAPE